MKTELLVGIIPQMLLCLAGHVSAIKCYGCKTELTRPYMPCLTVNGQYIDTDTCPADIDYCVRGVVVVEEYQSSGKTTNMSTVLRQCGSGETEYLLKLAGGVGCVTAVFPGQTMKFWTCKTDICNSEPWSMEKQNFDDICPNVQTFN